jgi:hypothetical protein
MGEPTLRVLTKAMVRSRKQFIQMMTDFTAVHEMKGSLYSYIPLL